MQTYCAIQRWCTRERKPSSLDQMVLFNIHDGAFDEITIKMENKAQAYELRVHERASGEKGNKPRTENDRFR